MMVDDDDAAWQVGWQGWTVFVEPVWQTVGGIRLHAGGILNVDEIAQVSVGIEQSLNKDAFRFTFGYCRRILPTPTFP